MFSLDIVKMLFTRDPSLLGDVQVSRANRCKPSLAQVYWLGSYWVEGVWGNGNDPWSLLMLVISFELCVCGLRCPPGSSRRPYPSPYT